MAPPQSPDATPAGTEALLREVTQALAPLVRLLVHHGVDHPRLAAALKRRFVEAALAELAAAGQPPTTTAIGLRAGLQRRDVKAQLDHLAEALPPKALSPTLPMQLVARWMSSPETTDADGAPLPLPVRSAAASARGAGVSEPRADGPPPRRPAVGGDGPAGSAASFDAAAAAGSAAATSLPSVHSLATSLSKDVHAQALLDELVRLNLVRVEDGMAHLLSEGFVPTREFGQMLGALSRNLHDHAQAAVANVLAGESRFLEYSLVADELRPESAQALHTLARRLWRSAYKRAVQEAVLHVERDKAAVFSAAAPETRVRFGVYFYAEPVQAPPTVADDAGIADHAAHAATTTAPGPAPQVAPTPESPGEPEE